MPLDWGFLAKYWWAFAIAIILASYKFFFWLCGAVIVPQDSIGVVNKKFA